jgi:hypothetical protein
MSSRAASAAGRPDVELDCRRRPRVHIRRRERERSHRQLLLAGQQQRTPRRGEHGHVRSGVEEGGSDPFGAVDLLEVVQNQEQAPVGQLLRQPLPGR